MARGSDELRRFVGIESTAAAYLQYLLTGLQVERFKDRVAPDDRIVGLRISALYPPHLVIELDVRHGCLLSTFHGIVPNEGKAGGSLGREPKGGIRSDEAIWRCL